MLRYADPTIDKGTAVYFGLGWPLLNVVPVGGIEELAEVVVCEAKERCLGLKFFIEQFHNLFFWVAAMITTLIRVTK